MRNIAKFVVICALIFLGIIGGGLVLFGTDSFARSDELLVAGLFLGIAWALSEMVLPKLSGESIDLASGTDLPGPWLIILFVLFIGGIASGVHSVFNDEPDLLRQAPSVASLDSELQAYSSQASDFDSEVLEGRGILEPGAIVVDVLSGSLHPLYRELPSGIRAVTPDNISTIIYVNSSKQPDSNRVLGKDRVDAYQQFWSIAIVSLRDNLRHVEYRNSIVGSRLGERLGIGKSRAGEAGLYRPRSSSSSSPELISGAELIFGDSGGAELKDGRRVTGVVGPPPLTEALEWITESEKWVEGADMGQKYLWFRILLWILVFGSLAAAPLLNIK